MQSSRSTNIFMFFIIFMMVSIIRADYVIRNLASNMEISNSCQVKITEELTYVFSGTSGNYTQLSRNIPFTIANQISTQQVSVEILEIKNQTNSLNLDLISISSTTLQIGSSAYIIVSALTPKIQLSSEQSYLEIRLKRLFLVSGPVRKYDQVCVVVYFYLKLVIYPIYQF